MKLSIIVPVLNEADNLPKLFDHLLPLQGQGCEIIFVDGGSCDGSLAIIHATGFVGLLSSPGRAQQMNVGANAAQGDVLLFLHADTRLPKHALEQINQKYQASCQNTFWGRFNVRLDSSAMMLKWVSFFINHRSRLTQIATGDQAIFVHHELFKQVNGFALQPIMEDVAISKTLKAISKPHCLSSQVITSARRWERKGIWPTIFLMWRLRLLFWLGVSPNKLAKDYL